MRTRWVGFIVFSILMALMATGVRGAVQIECRAAHAAFTGGIGGPNGCVLACTGLADSESTQNLAECARFAAPAVVRPIPDSSGPRTRSASSDRRFAAPAVVGPIPDSSGPRTRSASSDRWVELGISPVRIAGGRYRPGTPGANGAPEPPPYDIEIAPFEMSRTEVTVRQYRNCVDAGACADQGRTMPTSECNWGKGDRDDHPMNCLSRDDARAFAEWLGEGARLPSEAEWEWAARGRDEARVYPWGDTPGPSCRRVVMMEHKNKRGCGEVSTWKVCSRSPLGDSRDGICDLSGNVGEMIEDHYSRTYDDLPRDGSARSSKLDHKRAPVGSRGGGYISRKSINLQVRRRWRGPSFGLSSVGFRVVRSVQPALPNATTQPD